MDLEKIKKNKTIKELLEFSIINIDKPSGPTSFQVDDYTKKSFGLSKTSHFGTLDPKVTGVLPVALGRACRLSEYFMHKDKTYVGIMHLHKEIEKKELEKEMQKFIGKIKQLPPIKSRVKREEREREIKSFEILEKNEKEVLFLAEVEAGTYIRKLVHDLGLKIGGAHMTELRRIKAGIFSEEDENFVNLYNFKEAVEEFEKGNEEKLRKMLIPAEVISQILPVVKVKEESMKSLLTGKPLMKQDLENKEIPDLEIFVVFCGEKFIEVARKTEEASEYKRTGERNGRTEQVRGGASEKDIIARPEFVLN